MPAPVTTISKPSARASAAVARPTANSGSLRASPRSGCVFRARSALRLVAISACTPSRSMASASSNETLSSGSTVASWPVLLQRRSELERVGLGAGDEEAHQPSARKKSGPALVNSSAATSSASAKRLLGAAFAPRRVALAPVGGEDHAAEDETAASELRKAGNRRAAGALELGEEGALGGDGKRGRLMINGGEQLGHGQVVDAGLDADGALRHGRQHLVGRHRRGDAVGEAEPLQAGTGQQRRVGGAVLELAQPRLDVAAHGHNGEIGPQVLDLRLAPQRGGADHRPLGQHGEAWRPCG